MDRANDRLRELYCQLRDCGDEGVRALEELTKHEDMGVQLKAASRLAWINLPLTLEVMEDLQRGYRLYPEGPYERWVASTAASAGNIMRNRGPLGPDPYIKWQAAKEDKASGVATKPAKQPKGGKRTSERTGQVSSPDPEVASNPSTVAAKPPAPTAQGQGQLREPDPAPLSPLSTAGQERVKKDGQQLNGPVSEPVAGAASPPPPKKLQLLADMYHPYDPDTESLVPPSARYYPTSRSQRK
jgi:hypothetical protein